MLEKEFQYFLENRDELVKKYLNKYILIKDQKVAGVFDEELDAYKEGLSKFEQGSFLIQQCLPGDKTFTQTFRTRVVF